MALIEICKNIPGYGPSPIEVGDVADPTFLDLSGKADSGHNHDAAYAAIAHNHAGVYADAAHTHAGVYQPAGSYAAATHSHAWATDISGKPTTVAGYGITDAAVAPIATLVVPLTAQTRTFNILKQWEVIANNHTATIAAQTFVFPTDANSAIGQELRIFSRSIITTVTLTLNGNTIIGLALTTLPVNGNVAWRKVGTNLWARIQ